MEEMMHQLPLDGVRIVDLTMAWAGPMAVRVLGDMGAEVIKIEAAHHMDRWRGGTFAQRGTDRYPNRDPGERPWNRSSFFNTQNRNKQSLVMNLKMPEGNAIFKRLVAISDLVAENFSAGVMSRLHLDYPVLREIKPDIVMLSMPGFGRSGPERDFIAHGPTIDELAGNAFLQGYPGGPPLASGGFAWGDPIAGMNGAMAALVALVHRQRTGAGQHIDLSHLEAGVGFNFQAILEYTMNQRIVARQGNRHSSMAPHGCYPCNGADRWIVIAVRTDEEWRKLRVAMGEPIWAEDERFSTTLGRWQHQEELDRCISEWTIQYDHSELMRELQALGLAAGAVFDASEMANDPHLTERGFFEMVTSEATGPHQYPGMPWKMSLTPGRIRMPAPRFGEHNEHVLITLLGMSHEEVKSLEENQVIATEPLPQGD